MEHYVLLIELSLFSVAICGLHALKPRFGLAPLFVVVGLFEAFLFVAGKQIVLTVGGDTESVRLTANLLFGETASVSYMLFLPLILSSAVLIYVLEGTREARRFLLALIVVYVVHGVIDVVFQYHAGHPPAGAPNISGHTLFYYNMGSRISSLAAITVDFVVILVTYQFLVNRFKRIPLAIPLFVALVLAMMSDAMVYGLVRSITGKPEALQRALNLQILQKLQAGIVAGLPVAVYLHTQLKRHRDDVRRGILERGAFAVIDLRRQVFEMEEQLERQREKYVYIKDTFGRYVSPDVVDAIVLDPSKVQLGGELREVTILFADIRGYSTLSEGLEPTEIIGMLNRYYTGVSDVILANRGMINEIEGDAVLAVFGAPLDLPDHAQCAVNTAVGMLEAVEKLNEEWDADGTSERWRQVGMDRLSIRIGIHTGPVVVGNVGSEAHIKYAVIGDTVNIASRVEGLNKKLKTEVLVTSATADALDASNKVPLKSLGSHSVKGRTKQVVVYTFDDA